MSRLYSAAAGAALCMAATGAAWADPLSAPAMTPPLAANPDPVAADMGPLGKIYFGAQLSALGLTQNHFVAGDRKSRLDATNAQVEVQKTDGVLQFYVQAGAYSVPSLGAAYVKIGDAPDLTYGYVPVAYVKVAPSATFNIMAGKLPTLIGSEYTFTFQNMNIARGLLWNQEPAITRGVQANYTHGPLTVSASLNDGLYSNRYTTGSALVSYAVAPSDTVVVAASVNFKDTAYSSFATPLAQNNGDIYNLIWTHTAGPLTITPYLQYSHTPRVAFAGLPAAASSYGAAVLAKYSLSPQFSLAGRAEYIGSSGSQVSLLYGPGSKAWSLTLTPTWQLNRVFIRGEASYTRLQSFAPGAGFGGLGLEKGQSRAMVETGVLF